MGWAEDMDVAECICGHLLTDHDRDTLYCHATGCGCAGFEEPEEDGGE